MASDEGLYTVTAVSRLTGVAPDTLRAWERRHGVVAPVRSQSGRRMYRGDDVRRLRLLADAVRSGHAIGSISGLDEHALVRLLDHSATVRAGRPRALGDLLESLVAAVERYDADGCERMIGMVLASMPVDTVIDELVCPALVEVGARWQRGEMSIAQERLLSSVVRKLALNMLTTLTRIVGTPHILLGSLSGEGHELGALLAAVDAAASGVSCAYVGADLPGREFARMADRLGVGRIVIGVVQCPPPTGTEDELHDLHAHLTKPADIWLGGRGSTRVLRELPDLQLVHVDTLADFRRRVRATF
jgi:methanogenic corrinoid protein MtbC1